MIEKIYVTPAFALLSTRRKAAALERMRAAAEGIFCQTINSSLKLGLAEPIVRGLCYDVTIAIAKYIAINAPVRPPEWPEYDQPKRIACEVALDAFAATATEEQECVVRSEMTLTSARDGILVRTGNGA